MGVIQGALSIFLGAFFLSMMGSISRFVSSGMHSLSLNFYRGLLGIVLLGVGSLFLPYSLRGGNLRLLLLRGLLGGVAGILFFHNIQKGVPQATAYLFLYTYPIFATMIAWILLRERLRARELLAVAAAFGGIVVILVSKWKGICLEDMLALLVGVISGGSITTVRVLRKKHNPFIIYFYYCLVFMAIGSFSAPNIPAGRDIWIVLAFSVVGLGGHVLLAYGFRYVETARGSVLAMTEVFLAGLWGVLIFQETPSFDLFAGGVLIVASGVYLTVTRMRMGKEMQKNGE